jgi:hypothetical protein
MRTTLTLDPDVALRLKQRMEKEGLSLKHAVNEALRAGLSSTPKRARKVFRVEPHSCGFKPGVDLDKLNQLVDELEVEEVRSKLTR